MVTEVDRACEELIVEGIRAARPDDGSSARRAPSVAGTSGLRWVVDPLDGTTNYIYGHPGFAVSIAIARGDETLVGVVQDTIHDELFTAVRGAGAMRNGEPVRPTATTELGSALVATGFGYDARQREAQARALAERDRADPGRAPDGRRRRRPLLGRLRPRRRLLRARAQQLGSRRRRPDRRGGRSTRGAIGGGAAVAGSVLAATPALFEPLQAVLVEAGRRERRLSASGGAASRPSASPRPRAAAVSVGLLPTRTPFASRASFFAWAVPEEPEMIAPAWPICLPGGAVKPAM